MELQVRIHGEDPAGSVRGYAERRLRFALGRFSDQIGRVHALVEDISGPRGGLEKVCRIRAEVARSGHFVFQESVETTLQTAIDAAADRIGRTVARELRRDREWWAGCEAPHRWTDTEARAGSSGQAGT